MKRKREYGKTISYAFTTVGLLWIWLGIYGLSNTEFSNMDNDSIKTVIALSLIWSVIFLILTGLSFNLIKESQFEEVLEYKIHTYERWDRKSDEYKKYYITERIDLNSLFYFNFYIKDIRIVMNNEALEYKINNLGNGFSTFYGYETEEEAMKTIINEIKSFISDGLENKNIKIRNIKTLKTYTFEELKEK